MTLRVPTRYYLVWCKMISMDLLSVVKWEISYPSRRDSGGIGNACDKGFLRDRTSCHRGPDQWSATLQVFYVFPGLGRNSCTFIHPDGARK